MVKKESFPLRIWSGLFYPKHFKRMGQSIWLFGVFVDMITHEENGFGDVLGGAPITYTMIKDRIPVTRRQYVRYKNALVEHGYIICEASGRGLSIKVVKSKKYKRRTTVTKKSQDTPKHETDMSHIPVTNKLQVGNEKVTSDETNKSHHYIKDDIKEDIKETGNKEPEVSDYMKIWKIVHPIFNLPTFSYNSYSGEIIKTITRLGLDKTMAALEIFIKKIADHPPDGKIKDITDLFKWKKIDRYVAMIKIPDVLVYYACMICGDALQMSIQVFEKSEDARKKMGSCKCGSSRQDITADVAQITKEGGDNADIRRWITLKVEENSDPEKIKALINKSMEETE